MNELVKAMLRLSRQSASVTRQQYDTLIRAAAVNELRGLLNDDLCSLVRMLNRPLLLMPVPAYGEWYAITGRGLCKLNANTASTQNLGASMSTLSTWDMYSESADLSTVFTIMVGLNGNNPLTTYHKINEAIWIFAVEGPSKSFIAQTRRLSR